MDSEIVRIFDQNMKCIGKKTRGEVHISGDWHETFHCWFTIVEKNECYVLFQKRAEVKKDYPGLLDITSAGHLLAEEDVREGTREVEEELGVSIEFEDLISLGIIKGEIKLDQIWDREICHVFLYECRLLPEFKLQEDEVDSLYKIRLDDVMNLFEGTVTEITATEISKQNSKIVNKASFVGLDSYYVNVFDRIKKRLNKAKGSVQQVKD
ncbi:NUDIX domain-containing protein [Fictibacillus sp. WQ 8-8]|uniref:NUDIX hydrolase n=1 Tax=Fictibacillus sp. WQ 8-8 TaxID=2938788 RepID=UPI00210E47FB|nr:NUDIX domain-containing protein [Fictibacillus sp. WQ 8-8]MCQ6268541.1 NUDIX domain-containing protein [Fictibacillus sp. WQ 8-8]